MKIIYKILSLLAELRWEASVFSLLSSALLLLTSLLIFLKFRRRRGFPPGPPVLPVVGSLLSLASDDVLKTLQDLRTKYGDIYSLCIGKELVVVLNGFDAIHDALVKKGSHFVNRPPSVFKKIYNENPGILYSNGQQWKEQKTFLLKAIQDICMRNRAQNIENIVQLEVRALIKAVEEKEGVFDISDYVYHAGLNVMFLLTYGKRFEFGDKEADGFASNLHKIAKQVAKMQVLCNCFPFLQIMPGDLLGNKYRLSLKEEIYSFVRRLGETGIEDKHNHNHCKVDLQFTISDAFTEQIERVELDNLEDAESDNDNNARECSFTEAQREDTMVDLIGAGGDTTATAIMWLILYLVREPVIQDHMYTEIQTVIGDHREPCIEDRQSMPYTQAVIMESLRIAVTAPLALPHSVSKDTYFHGFLLPKDTTIIANTSTALNDPEVWDNPEKFIPDRFLNSDKSDIVIPEQCIPFSVGPRACIGESVAKMEVFLTIVGLVQRFELQPESPEVVPGTKGELGITYRPQPFSMQFRKR